MEINFSTEEIRVLGVLMEKQMTVPEYYPMTPNAIKTACNQKSNRNPIVNYDEDVVFDTLQSLRKKEMLILVSTSGSRVRKYKHRMKEIFFLSRKETAALCVQMLRGPQTVGEIRTRTGRMVEFENLDEVTEVLTDLSSENRKPQPLDIKLPVWPGQKEHRYMHLFAGKPDIEKLAAEAKAFPVSQTGGTSRYTELSEKIEALSAEIKELRDQFNEFKRQFE